MQRELSEEIRRLHATVEDRDAHILEGEQGVEG